MKKEEAKELKLSMKGGKLCLEVDDKEIFSLNEEKYSIHIQHFGYEHREDKLYEIERNSAFTVSTRQPQKITWEMIQEKGKRIIDIYTPTKKVGVDKQLRWEITY